MILDSHYQDILRILSMPDKTEIDHFQVQLELCKLYREKGDIEMAGKTLLLAYEELLKRYEIAIEHCTRLLEAVREARLKEHNQITENLPHD